MDFFLLTEEQRIFSQAIFPKSQGGDEDFKLLALYGDRILNLVLLDIITDKGIKNSGQITQIIQSFQDI